MNNKKLVPAKDFFNDIPKYVLKFWYIRDSIEVFLFKLKLILTRK
jgi:hypothetical protein